MAEILALGDRYKWNRRTLRAASLTVSVPILLTVLVSLDDSALPLFGTFALLLGFQLLPAIWRRREQLTLDTRVGGLETAPPQIRAALVLLARLRDDLQDLLVSVEDVFDNLVAYDEARRISAQTRDWLRRFAALPAPERAWLARREARVDRIATQVERLFDPKTGSLSRAELSALRRAMIEFERMCERAEIVVDPYRGTRAGPMVAARQERARRGAAAERARGIVEQTLARVRGRIAVVIGVTGVLVLVSLGSNVFVGIAALGCIPLAFYLAAKVREYGARRCLEALFGSQVGESARQAARRERRLDLLMSAGVVTVALAHALALGLPWILDPHRAMGMSDERVYFELVSLGVFPSVLIGVLLLGERFTRWHRAQQAQASGLELMATSAFGEELDPLRLALHVEQGLLLDCVPSEVPDQLRAIERGLMAFERMPASQRRELEARGFDLGPARAKLDLALSHGGLMARSQLHELVAELRAPAKLIA